MSKSQALAKTFKFLKQTENEAAVELLTLGLGSSCVEASHASLRSLMEHRSVVARKEVLRRLRHFNPAQRRIVEENPARMARVVQGIIKCHDLELVRTAIAAARAYRLYDAVPSLVGALNTADPVLRRELLDAIFALAESFYEDLRQAKRSVDLDTERRKMTAALEEAAGQLKSHQDRRMVDALLMVTAPTNATLKRVLQSPREALHQPIVESLRTSEHGGVIRLLLAYFDDPYLPVAARKAICERVDAKFVENLLQLINLRSQRACEVLRSIDRLPWAEPGHPTLQQVDGECQRQAIELLIKTAVPKPVVLQVLIWLLKEGKVTARQCAAERLAEFEHPEAAEAVVASLDDPDPIVKANLLKQLRPRRISGALTLLIQMIDVDAVPVKKALREALPEFSFRQYFANFESLPEQRAVVAGCLVAKIDLETPDLLLAEMNSLSPVRRRKALKAAAVMGMVSQVEARAIELLNDDDHTVRVAAAKSLSQCDSRPTWEALRDALLDRSAIVREAAENSLQLLCSTLAESDGDSDDEYNEMVTSSVEGSEV